MSYAANNAFVNPQTNLCQFWVKQQPEIKDIKRAWQEWSLRDKYRIPGENGPDPDCYLLRWDTARAIADAKADPVMGPKLQRLLDIVTADFPVKHSFDGRGVELSPAGRPMHEDNIGIDLKDGGIPVAVAKAQETGKMLVSKDVFRQLKGNQKEACAAVDGMHQFATGDTGFVNRRNPTGYWTAGDGDVGHTVDVKPGVKQTYTIVPRTIELTLHEVYVPSVTFEVGTAVREVYGLFSGSYRAGVDGIVRTGDCVGVGDTDKTIRQKLERYALRDKRGFHGSDPTLMGECSYKINGIYTTLESKYGTVTWQYRNGKTFSGKLNYDVDISFEQVYDDIIYLLYPTEYRGNKMSFDKSFVDYFRERIEFKIRLVHKDGLEQTLCSTKCADGLPADGVVIWGKARQSFYKEENTVDITKAMAKVLIEEDDIEIDNYDNLVDGPIYEFGVVDKIKLRFIKLREPLSKILPNKLKNVRRTMNDPNLSAVRDHHRNCLPDVDCQICRYI